MTAKPAACPPPEATSRDFSPARWPVTRTVAVLRLAAGQTALDDVDELVEEVPVALTFNGIPHATVLASPADLKDFALGFALTEYIIDHADEMFGCETLERPDGIEVRIEIAAHRLAALKERRHMPAGHPGGLAGFNRAIPQWTDGAVSSAAVSAALAVLDRYQPIRTRTGAAHAAAWVRPDGCIDAVREDVGRHNALDKLIGWRATRFARDETEAAHGFALVSSRVSHEMVRKSACAGIGALIAVSAPTAMACRMAEQSGLLLAGFARGERLVAYAHAERLLTD